MLEYRVTARRIDSHGSEAMTKEARIVLDTDMAGRADAFNPAEDDYRIALLHKNLQTYGTIYNTLAGATDLVGTIRSKH